MAQYRKFDRSSWPRKDHFRYFTETLPAGYSVTADVDVRNLLDACHEKGLRFYASFIWCTAKILNASEHFRLFLDEDGELCVWDQLVPNYTIFHEDDKTFSDCWTDYDEDFFFVLPGRHLGYGPIPRRTGRQGKAGPAGQLFCISSVPWLRFTGYHSFTTEGSQIFPGDHRRKVRGDRRADPDARMHHHRPCGLRRISYRTVFRRSSVTAGLVRRIVRRKLCSM